jgi:hypothetical protein
MAILDITIKFYIEASESAQKQFIYDDVPNLHVNSIIRADDGEYTWIVSTSIEDEKPEKLIFDKLSGSSIIKAFFIESREIKENPLDALIPYIPIILTKLIGGAG